MNRFLLLILIFFVMNSSPVSSQTSESKAAPTVGICLSGGGALGFAHIGALQALEEYGIHATHLSGTSMGSIVGLMYAAGYTPAQILEMVKAEKAYKLGAIFKLNLSSRGGLSKHTKLLAILDKYIPFNNFDSLQIPFYVCCVKLKEGTVHIVHSGNQLKNFVVASASIPMVYEYYTIEGVDYVDGGVMNNFPVEPLVEAKCDKIIGINVINFTPLDTTPKIDDVWPAVFTMMNEAANNGRYPLCDFYVPIKELNTADLSISSYKKYEEIYQKGYDSMVQFIRNHPEILK